MNKDNGMYSKVISKTFFDSYQTGCTSIKFSRESLVEAAIALKLARPKNIGDILYSFRFRQALPSDILQTAPDDKEWAILLDGIGRYEFKLVRKTRITPTPGHRVIKIPDATPELVTSLSANDEQALLTKIRYNRLLDIFLGIAGYSLQNHLRTTVENVGQVEIDELYAGVDGNGVQCIIPVQAKGGSDQLGVVQTRQDLAFCKSKYPMLVPRAVAAHFDRQTEVIVLFELSEVGDDIIVVSEKHYLLAKLVDIAPEDSNSQITH